MSAVRRLEIGIGSGELISSEYSQCALPQELGSTDAAPTGHRVETGHQIVVELDKYFTPCHHHMVGHMGRTLPGDMSIVDLEDG